MDLAVADRKEPVSDVLRRLGCFERATRGSGTATAAAALAIFLRYGKSIEHAVTKAVNLIGSDTDTIGALVGGLAGAFCGYSSIPERWAVRLQDLDYFQRVCDSVLRICNRTDRSSGLEVDQSERWASFPRITDVVQKRTVRTNQRVSHPILGPGWVRSTYSQAIRRKGGGTVVFSRVVFDIGQSCVFHSKAGSVGQPKGEQSEDDGPEDPEE